MKLKIVTTGGAIFYEDVSDATDQVKVRKIVSNLIMEGMPISVESECGKSYVIPVASIDYIEVLP